MFDFIVMTANAFMCSERLHPDIFHSIIAPGELQNKTSQIMKTFALCLLTIAGKNNILDNKEKREERKRTYALLLWKTGFL